MKIEKIAMDLKRLELTLGDFKTVRISLVGQVGEAQLMTHQCCQSMEAIQCLLRPKFSRFGGSTNKVGLWQSREMQLKSPWRHE